MNLTLCWPITWPITLQKVLFALFSNVNVLANVIKPTEIVLRTEGQQKISAIDLTLNSEMMSLPSSQDIFTADFNFCSICPVSWKKSNMKLWISESIALNSFSKRNQLDRSNQIK